MEKQGSFLNVNPKPQHWCSFSIGHSGFWLSLTVDSRKKQMSCHLRIRHTKHGFFKLKEQKDVIEKELNTNLEWEEKLNKKSSIIAQYKAGNFQNKDEWPELFEWLKQRAEAFHKTFQARIKDLDWEEDKEVA